MSAQADKSKLLNAAQEAEVREQREAGYQTRRATVPALEEILYEPIPVLDHGFVRVIDYMGDDAAIVQAARVSYGKGTKKTRGDAGLINYLLRHRHTTPFEMCEIKFHVKLPIFVARQWIRHRTANVNEYSARYSILDKEFYVPDQEFLSTRRDERAVERNLGIGQPDLFGSTKREPKDLAAQSLSNHQGRAQALSSDEAKDVLDWIIAESSRDYTIYLKLLNENEKGEVIDSNRQGIARELARMVLPTNIYTQWYWKIDLHNLLHFLSLRTDPHAQYEIRAYAEVMLETVRRWVPATYGAFESYVLEGAQLSGGGLAVVRRLLAGERVTQEESGLSKREWRELMATLGRSDQDNES